MEGAQVNTDIRKRAPIRNPKVPGGDGYAGHLGDDYGATAGSVVVAPVSGIVRTFDKIYGGQNDPDGPYGPYGTIVTIEVTVPANKSFAREGGDPRPIVGNKVTVFLGHLDLDPAGRTPVQLSQVQYVTAGQLIGYVGTYVEDSLGHINLAASTGGSASDHSHVHVGILPWGIGMLDVNELPLMVNGRDLYTDDPYGISAFPGNGYVSPDRYGYKGTTNLIKPPVGDGWFSFFN